jgi:hypothetical protein
MRSATEAKSWPVTEGQVTSSDLQTCPLCDGPKYSIRVSYEYLAVGQAHVGRRVLFGSHSFDAESEAKALAMKYPSGATVSVHYNASDPSESVLEPRFAVATTDMLLVLGVLGVEGWLIIQGVRFLPQLARRTRGRLHPEGA